MRDATHELGGGGGDAGEVADEVERDALRSEDRAPIARDRHQRGFAGDGHAVAGMTLDLDVRGECAERGLDQRQAGDGAGLAGHDHGAAARAIGHGGD